MLKDALVTHKSFGAGKVTDISDQYIMLSVKLKAPPSGILF